MAVSMVTRLKMRRARLRVVASGNPGGMSGKRHSPETRAKLSKYNILHPQRYWKGKVRERGAQNALWKGEKAKYVSKHAWILRHWGRPANCEHCGTTQKRMYHWANVSGKYKRIKLDWVRLCVPCHSRFDRARKGKPI